MLDIILDPFLGFGTTMIACRNLKRSCIGIEINPKYVEIAKQRLNWGSSLSNEIKWKFKVIKSDRYSIY
jgi:site-specific DNA-methyltransferase (adenine-specific)